MGSHILRKPGTFEKAAKQLANCSGNWVSFTTAISLIDHRGIKKQAAECFRIKYRELNSSEIDEYLKIDEPFDCAGSIKAESTGITLLDDTDGRDFNTLVGLPLMLCQELLDDYGYPLSTLRKSSI
jgi:predicted house-cleaning NTP pyrophosphatase (Maf/HAM1 superfamily)